MIVLVAADGSAASNRAVSLLASYRGERGGLELLLVNVQRRPVSLWPQPALDPGAVDAVLLEAGRGLLEPARAELAAAGFALRCEVRLSIPAQALLEEAAGNDAGLIVMGTRGAGAIAALGSVAARVVHGAAAPVLLVPEQARLPSTFGQEARVLLAMDGSPHALRAARWLAGRPQWLGSIEVDVVHVQEPLPLLAALVPPHRDLIGQWSGRQGETATSEARELLAAAGIPHRWQVGTGDPAATIIRLSRELQAGFIVMGTRGLGAAHHAFIGSVALNTAHAAGIPVVLIPGAQT